MYYPVGISTVDAGELLCEYMKSIKSNNSLYSMWILLSETRDALYKVRQQELSRHNISVRQFAVLHVLQAMEGKATPTEIAHWPCS